MMEQESIWLEVTLPVVPNQQGKVFWQWRGSGPHTNGSAFSAEQAYIDAWESYEMWAATNRVPA